MHLIEVLARASRRLWKDLGKRWAGGACSRGPADSTASGLWSGEGGGAVGVDSCVVVAIGRSRDREVEGAGLIGPSASPAVGKLEGDARNGRG